jgi:hypothetical protein
MKRAHYVLLFLVLWVLGATLIYESRAAQPSIAVEQTTWNIGASMVISFTLALAYVFIWVWEAVVMRFTNKAFILKLLVASALVMAVFMWIFATFPTII